MKVVKIILALLLIAVVLLVSFGCNKSGAATPTATQTVTAKSGDISIAVTGTGNLALANPQDLSFELAGTVKEVLVSAGDSVTQGQELARLDTADLEKQLKSLQKSLDNAQHNLETAATAVTKAESNVAKAESNVTKAQNGVTTAQDAVTKAQNNVTKAERQVVVKELNVQQAELDLQSVQNNLTSISVVKTAQDAVDRAQYDLDLAQKSQLGASTRGDASEAEFWGNQIRFYQDSLAASKKELQATLDGTSVHLTGDTALQLAKAQLQVTQSEMALEDAHTAVADAQKSVVDSQKAVETARTGVVDAQNAVTEAESGVNDAKTAVANAQYNQKQAEEAFADAQSELADAQALSPAVTAPFAGLITAVKVNGGDQVQKGKVAFTLADPTQFEANIMVNENDIFSLKLNGDANVEVDALSGLSFPAKITAIAPTATTQQGVVNYQVTVALTSTRPASAGLASANGSGLSGLRPGLADLPPGSLPTNLPPGFSPRASGRELPTGLPGGMASGNFSNLPGGFASGNGSSRSGSATAQAQGVALKAGLSATVNVIIEQKTGVLTVPSRAITRQGQDSTVQKVNGSSVETVTVQTGLTDGTNTEIMEGLSENDQVLVKTSATSSGSTGNRNVPFGAGGAIRIP